MIKLRVYMVEHAFPMVTTTHVHVYHYLRVATVRNIFTEQPIGRIVKAVIMVNVSRTSTIGLTVYVIKAGVELTA